jgi:hypothetical protein
VSVRRQKAGGLVGVLTVEIWANGEGLHDAQAVDKEAIRRLRSACQEALAKLERSVASAPERASTEAERQVGEGLPEPR